MVALGTAKLNRLSFEGLEQPSSRILGWNPGTITGVTAGGSVKRTMVDHDVAFCQLRAVKSYAKQFT